MRRIRRVHVFAAALAAALCVPASGATSSDASPSVITKIGKAEGSLNLIAWDGYTKPQWVKPFVRATGCKVKPKYGNTSDEMVTLMRTGQYDAVSASVTQACASFSGRTFVRSTPSSFLTSRTSSRSSSRPATTPSRVCITGSRCNGAEHASLQHKEGQARAEFVGVLYSSKFKGKITVPDNPIQIADAALYLSKTKPSLGITDPYELNDAQFKATVDLLKKQRPLVKKYWASAGDEIDLFKNGSTTVGASWPYQTITLQAAKAPVKDLIPKEGADRLGRHLG